MYRVLCCAWLLSSSTPAMKPVSLRTMLLGHIIVFSWLYPLTEYFIVLCIPLRYSLHPSANTYCSSSQTSCESVGLTWILLYNDALRCCACITSCTLWCLPNTFRASYLLNCPVLVCWKHVDKHAQNVFDNCTFEDQSYAASHASLQHTKLAEKAIKPQTTWSLHACTCKCQHAPCVRSSLWHAALL